MKERTQVGFDAADREGELVPLPKKLKLRNSTERLYGVKKPGTDAYSPAFLMGETDCRPVSDRATNRPRPRGRTP